VRLQLRGRQPEDAALAEVRALIGEAPPQGHRRDLLIEHLHRLQDTYRGLHRRHLVALAHEMNLPRAEVFEVASFYHHFDLLDDGQQAAALTVRVCDSLSCAMAGAAICWRACRSCSAPTCVSYLRLVWAAAPRRRWPW